MSVRSGGHGISSISTHHHGTVIDLGGLATIERVSPDSDLLRIGPGARWGEVAAALYPWGLAISSGDSGDVGVGGLATAGGVGLMGRAHGLTIDRVTAAELVTADGSVLALDSERHPDLFWAVRGPVSTWASSFPWSSAPRARLWSPGRHSSTAWTASRPSCGPGERRWRPPLPEISAFLYLLSGGFALATVVHAGDDPAVAGRDLSPFLSVAPLVGRRAELLPYAAVVAAAGAPHRGQQGGRIHSGLAVHLDGELSERLEGLVRAGFGELLQIRSVGGAVNDVPADATAYAHRHQNFSITAVAPYASRDFDEAWAAVHPSLDGLYLSFESAFTPERLAEAFPGTTLQRLRDIKRRIDPENVFHQNFPVADVRPTTGRGCELRTGAGGGRRKARHRIELCTT